MTFIAKPVMLSRSRQAIQRGRARTLMGGVFHHAGLRSPNTRAWTMDAGFYPARPGRVRLLARPRPAPPGPHRALRLPRSLRRARCAAGVGSGMLPSLPALPARYAGFATFLAYAALCPYAHRTARVAAPAAGTPGPALSGSVSGRPYLGKDLIE